MKLRLPHRLHAALVAALASVSFTTLCSGALTAAFFLGSQAFAEEAADNPGAPIDIGDSNLDAQAAIDEEEGKGEAKEPGSAPINQAGFKGIRGSSDDFDRQSTAATESSIGTENVGTADQANYGSASADLPSNDLGFTSNPYASGSSNGSVVDSPVTSFTQATAVPAVRQVQYVESTTPTTSSGTTTTGAATGGYSATPVSGATGGGSGYSLSSPAMPRAAVVTVPATTDAPAPAAEAAMTDSGSADSTPADELGSTTPSLSVGGASLVRASYSAPAPAMLSAADQQAQAATTYKGVTYSGYIYNIDTSTSTTFHDRNFTNYYSNDGGTTWLNSTVFNGNASNKIYYNGTEQKTTTGNVNFWRFAFGDGNGKYSTLRLTDGSGTVYLESRFTPLTLGGLIAESGDATYIVGRKSGGCAVVVQSESGTDANMYIGANTILSSGADNNGNTISVNSGGTWVVDANKTLTLGRHTGSAFANTAKITFKDGVRVNMTGGGTVDLTYTNALETGIGAAISVGENTLLKFASSTKLGGTITNAGTVTFAGTVTLNNDLSGFDYEAAFTDYETGTTGKGFAGAKDYFIYKNTGSGTCTLAEVTYNGETKTLTDGKMHIDGETDYTTYYIQADNATMDLAQAISYAQGQSGNLTTVNVQGTGATITVGSNQSLNTLNIRGGKSATVNGTGTLSLANLSLGSGSTLATAGTVTMNVASYDTSKTLNLGAGTTFNYTRETDQTLTSGQSLNTTGAGTFTYGHILQLQDGSMSLGSNSNISEVYTRGTGTINLTGGTHEWTKLGMGQNQVSNYTLNVQSGATLHITGTAVADSNDHRYSGSFQLSHWDGTNTLNVYGKLISNAVISSWDGTPTINVNTGGLLELHQGLTRNYNSNSGDSRDNASHKVTLNVKSGGELSVGNTPSGDTDTHAGLVVNMENGSKLTGYYADSVESVAVHQNLVLAPNASVGVEVAQDKAMTIDSVISGNGASLTKAGTGTLTLTGSNSYTGGTTVSAGTLVASNASALGTGAVNVTGGTLDLTTTVGTGSLSVGNGATLKFAGTGMLTSDGDLTLASGSILDLSNIAYSESPVTLASVTSGSSIVNNGAELVNVADGYSGALSVSGNSLVLTFTPVTEELIWAGTATDHTWTNGSSTPWQGGTFSSGSNVSFDSTAVNSEVLVQSAISAGSVTVSGQDYTFNFSNGGSLTASSLSVTDHSLSLAGEGTMEVTSAATIGTGAGITVGQDATLLLSSESAAQAALPKVAGAGAVIIGENATINTGVTSVGTGTLSVANGKKLTLGTNTSGQTIDLSSFGGLVLGASANIDTKATKVTINNLTANGSTINILDSPSAGGGEPAGISLELKGITTLDGNLTITSGWKYKVNIAEITGNHDLTLTGGNEKHYAEIGNADIHALKVGDNMTNVKLTGTVALSDNLEAKRGTIEVSGTTSVGRDLDLSVSDAADGRVLVKSDGTLTTKGMWGRPAAHLYIENGGQLSLTDAGLQLAGTGDTNAEVATTSNSSFATNSDNWTISNAAVSTTKGMTLANTLTNSTLTTANDVTLSNAANTLTATTVTANTLTVSAGMDLGAVTVNDGATLALSSSSPVTIGSGTIEGTLKLGKAEQFVVDSGAFTFASGSTLDLTGLGTITGTSPITLGTANGTGSFSDANLDSVTLNFSGTLQGAAQLVVQDGALVLTFVDKDLIWDGGTGTWDVNNAPHWHTAEASTPSLPFWQGSNVKFENGTARATLGDNITAAAMALESGADLTVDTNGNNLTVAALAISGGASLATTGETGDITIKSLTGAGDVVKGDADTMTISGDNTGFTGSITISGGTVMVESDTALGQLDASRHIEIAEGGTLDVNGREGTGAGYTVTMSGGTLTNTGDAKGTGKRQYATHLILTDDSQVVVEKEFGLIGSNYAATSMDLGGNTLTIEGTSAYNVINATVTGGGAIDVHSGTLAINAAGNANQRGTFASNFVLSGGTLTGNDLTLADDIYIDTKANSEMSLSVKRRGHAVTFKGDSDLTVSRDLTGPGSIVKEGAGALSFTGSLDVDGTIQLGGGSLALNPGQNKAVNVNIIDPNAFDVFDEGNMHYSYQGTSGYLDGTAQYYLVKGAANTTASHTGSITGAAYVDSPEGAGAGDVIVSVTRDGTGTYYVNQNMTYGEDAFMADATGFSIKEGYTLTAFDTSTYSPAKALHGEGTYALASTATSLNSGLSLGDDWTGIVRLTNASANSLNFASLAKGTQSTIEFKGYTGFSNAWNGTNVQNIKLTTPDGGGVAWNASGAATSYDNNTAIYSGTWSGDGTMNIAPNKLNYTFSGDISQWEGKLETVGSYTNTFKLTFTGDSHEINAEIAGLHNTNQMNLVVDTDATFGKKVAANQLTINPNRTAKLQGGATLGALAGAGSLVVNGGTVTVGGNGGHTGTTTVTAGTLDLTTTVSTGALFVADGATLKLAYVNGLDVNGDLTLNSGSTLDLSNLAYRSGETVQLASYTGKVSYEGVNITLKRPDGSATLSDDGEHLLLTFGVLDDIIWAGTEGNNTWQDSGVWKFDKTFSPGADVYFDSSASKKEVLVNSAITAGTMTVSDAYTFNVDGSASLAAEDLAGNGALTKTGEGTMTVTGAGADYTGAVAIDEGVLSVTDGAFAAKMLQEATGEGVLELNTDASLDSTKSSRMTGTLRIAKDRTLTVGTKDGQNNSLASFDSVVLDGGTIYWNSAGGQANRLQNVTITEKGGTFQIFDINASAVEWTGTTTLEDGSLTLLNSNYGGKWNIEKLTGRGNFNNTSTGGSENLAVTIGSIENYQGDIRISNPKTTLTATLNNNANIGTVTKANGATVNLIAELGEGETATLGGGSVNNLTVNSGRLVNDGTLTVDNLTVNAGGTLDVFTDGLTATTVSVNGGTIAHSGTGTATLDIENLNVGSNGALLSGNVNLGTSENPMTTLHLENTLISKGNNAVYANAVTFVGDLGESVGDGSTFKDTVSGDTANGYVVTATVVIVENAAGTTLTTNLGDGKHTITHDGWTYTLAQDERSNIYISLMASTERAMQGDYYVNSGTLTYGDSGNASGQERTNTLFVNGGNLIFKDTNLKEGVALHVHKDGEVTLGVGRTLAEGAVHVKAGATMTLKGSGTYTLDTATLHAHGILPAGTVLAAGENGFTGTVMVSKDSVLNGTDLSGLVNGTYSRVGFNGATGSLKTGDIAQNIHLENSGSQVALSMNTGTSGENHTFTGAITGTGTLARSYVTGSGNIGGVQNYEFSGNLSGWTGVFDNQVEGAANTTNLTFSENATVVNAEIKNGVAGSTGPLNVITTGSDGTEFNRSVTATSFTANGANASFNAALRLTGNASAEDGAKLVINNSAAVGGSLSGDVEVTSSGNLTVGGPSTLDNLTDNGMASFNNTVSASGAVTVNEGASLYLNNGGISLGNEASLSISSGSMVGLSGWVETSGTPTESGVVKTGFTGGRLFSGNGSVDVQTGSYFMKDGAKFLYSGEGAAGNRVTVHTGGDKAGTVDIINAIYYNVHTNDTKSMDDVKAAADVEQVTLDYIHIQSDGKLTGVTDKNKGTYGIGNSGLQGSGTIAVGENGQLTDDVSLMSFGGSITVGSSSTLVTDGTNTRTIRVNGGTYKATDDITLGSNVTFSGRGNDMPTIEVGEGNTVTMVKLQGEAARQTDLHKTGEGTLHLTDTSTTGARTPVMTGNMTIDGGTVVLTVHRHLNGASDGCGIVDGNITMAGGTDLVMEGFDALGNKDQGTKAGQIVMNAGTADNLTTLSFTRNGSDPETLQHTTLSTDIVMNGNTEMSGLRLNAYGTHNEGGLGGGAYIHASGMNNTITNTFAMRENAYFEVDADSELVLLGNMELFNSGAESKKVIKTGEGVLDFAGDNSTLHAIDIQDGLVEVTGNLTFTGPNANQFLMAEGAEFAVQNGATFNYRGWLFENKDGTHAAGTVTAAASSTTNILEDSKLVVSGMKLTNNNTGNQAISARLDGVQLMHTGGNVTINNAPVGTTQHIASLTVKTGETTLHSAKLDAASVNPGATLSFSDDEKVELGSTILNGGTVNLAGTINVSDLSSFTPQKGAGFLDTKIHTDTPSDTYNGFYQGSTYYLIQEEAGGSTVSVAENLALTYKGNSVTDFAKETGTHSYWFRVAEPSTLYYLNGEVGANTIYRENSTENLMCAGPGEGMHTTGIVMNAAGARLTLASDLLENVRTITEGSSGIEAKQNGTIDIQSGVTLHQSDLSGDSGVLVSLVGEGTFDLVGTELKSVSSGLTDGSAWQGTVRASGAADNMNATMMGNVNSTLLLDGVKGTLTNDDTQYVMKVVLQNGNGALTGKALDNTFSTGAHRTFTNTVSGDGDIQMTGEASGSTQSIAFTGDVKGWTGDFTTASRGTTNLAFNNKATEINADVIQGAGSTINLSVGPTVDAEGDPAEQVFNGNVTASSLTVEAGANTTLNNTTTISGVIDATADNAKLHVHGTTTADELKVGTGSVSIQNTDGMDMAAISTSYIAAGNADITGGVKMQSADGQAILAGTAGEQPVTRVDSADIALQSSAASLKIENLVLADDTMVRGAAGYACDLVISQKVVQEMSDVNTDRGADAVVSTTALTMSGTKDVTMTFDNDKVANLNFYSMCQMAQISGSAGTLVFDFTGMDGYNDWEHTFSAYGFIGVNFDPEVAMALKAANQQKEAINAADLQVVARTKDADGKLVERIGFYSNGGDGAVVGSVFYFQVPEPATSTLSLLALAALAARRRRK